MARRNANLAGLAALGALGYKLANAGTKMPTASGAVAAAPAAASIDRAVYDDDINPDVIMGSSRDLGDELGTRQNLETGEYYSTMMSPKRASAASPSAASPSAASPSAASKKVPTSTTSREEEDQIRANKPRGRYSPIAAPKQTIGKTYPTNPARLKDEDAPFDTYTMKKGGKVKKMASGGMTSSASKRADGIATKGKTKCKMY